MNGLSITFIIISMCFGGIALLLACVGISTPNWQSTKATIDGQIRTLRTANFFYSCRLSSNGSLIGCNYRSLNREINQYYPIVARGNQTEWNRHLDSAAGLSIVGIIFIFLGILTTILMFFDRLPGWLFLISPSCLFLACLFMLAGMAEGSYVLYYNDYSANLYQTAHLLAIFSFLINCIAAGRVSWTPGMEDFNIPVRKQSADMRYH